MRKVALVLTTAFTVGLGALAAPAPAEAGWRGGFGPGLAGGFVAGALIGGLASGAYAYGPGYGYYGRPGYGYGGYAPAYYGGYPAYRYGPVYYGGYGPGPAYTDRGVGVSYYRSPGYNPWYPRGYGW
jgi:hypothetical protein